MAIRSLLITNHLRNNCYCCKLQFEARNLVQFLLPNSKPSIKHKYIHNRSSRRRLETEILRLKSPSIVLQNWVNNGKKVKLSQLNVISKQLLKSRRYKQALEVPPFLCSAIFVLWNLFYMGSDHIYLYMFTDITVDGKSKRFPPYAGASCFDDGIDC